MPREDYHIRQAEKLTRYQDLATKHGRQADQLSTRAHDMAACIPMGQPILVGHHSEKRDRNFRDRIHRTWEKSVEEQEKAQHYAWKAARIEENRSVSSDNPEAVDLLKEKLQKLEANRDKFKAINKIVKSRRKDYSQEQKIADLMKIGVKEKTAIDLFTPDFCGRIGVPDYVLTNDGAEIRRLKARIEQLGKDAEIETSERMIGDVRMVDSAEDNRIMLFFPGIPDQEVRTRLKQNGFRWSPSAGAWQAYRTNRSRAAVQWVLKEGS